MAIVASDDAATSPYRALTTRHPLGRSPGAARTVLRTSNGWDEAHDRRGSRAVPRRSAGSWKSAES
jgi:hypothetical protein